MISKNNCFCRGILKTPDRNFNKSAFTLVELLVVIAIIAMLLAIMTPVINKAREAAKKTICLSNMRQMGIAVLCYHENFEGRFPPSSCHISDENWQQYWLYAISKYVQSGLMFKCPSDKSKHRFVNWLMVDKKPDESFRWSSFGYNSQLDPGAPENPNKYNKISNIKKPSACVWICEAPQDWTNIDHIHPEGWFNIKLAHRQIDYLRHKNSSNYLFTDGHSENLRFEQTFNWPDRCFWFPQSAPLWPY